MKGNGNRGAVKREGVEGRERGEVVRGGGSATLLTDLTPEFL